MLFIHFLTWYLHCLHEVKVPLCEIGVIIPALQRWKLALKEGKDKIKASTQTQVFLFQITALSTVPAIVLVTFLWLQPSFLRFFQ